VVVEAAVARAYVRQPDADIFDLPFDREIELVNLAVIRVDGISRDALRSDRAGARGKRIRKSEQRLAVLNGIEEALANLERPIREISGETPQRLGKDSVAAAKNRLVVPGSPGESETGIEVVQRRRFLRLAGDHVNGADGVQRADFGERILRHD